MRTSAAVMLAWLLMLAGPVPAGPTARFPVVAGEYYVVERMLVKPGQEAWFEAFWKDTLLPVFEQIEGFEGGFISTVRPDPALAEADYDFGPLLPLGPPDKAFLPHGGIQLNGVVTDTQINFDSVMRGTYNYKVVHFWKDAAALQNLVPGFEAAWRKVHGEGNAWEILRDTYFVKLENHWDLVYRVIR